MEGGHPCDWVRINPQHQRQHSARASAVGGGTAHGKHAARRGERARAAAMAFSQLSGDEQGVILGQLRDTLEPHLVMYFSGASKELRALLPPAARQQLRADYVEATALCLKVGLRGCKELREAAQFRWWDKDLSEADLATLAKLGSVLPALESLLLYESSGSFNPDGVQRLAEGLVAGALPAVTYLARRGPRRPRGAAAACRHAAAAGWRAEEAQAARPRLHPDHRCRVRGPRHHA